MKDLKMILDAKDHLTRNKQSTARVDRLLQDWLKNAFEYNDISKDVLAVSRSEAQEKQDEAYITRCDAFEKEITNRRRRLNNIKTFINLKLE